MGLKSLLQSSQTFLHQQQGEPKAVIGATEYNVALSTLRRDEPITFGGTDKTLETTVTINRADLATRPATASTMVIEDDNVRLRVEEVHADPAAAVWTCHCSRDGAEFFLLTEAGDKLLNETGERLLTEAST